MCCFLGYLKDTTGTFKISLILAGCLEITGVLIAFPAIFVTAKNDDADEVSNNRMTVAV